MGKKREDAEMSKHRGTKSFGGKKAPPFKPEKPAANDDDGEDSKKSKKRSEDEPTHGATMDEAPSSSYMPPGAGQAGEVGLEEE